MRKNWRTSIVFRKTFMIFVAIMIPIYGIGIGIYNYGANTIREELCRSIFYQQNFVIGKMETLVEKLQNQHYGIWNSRNTQNISNRYGTMTAQQKYNAYYMLREQMNAILLSDTSFTDVVICFPDSNIEYSVKNGKRDFMQEDEVWLSADMGLNFYSDEIFLKSIYPFYFQSLTSETKYEPMSIVTKIDSNHFLDILELNDSYENVGLAVITDTNIYTRGEVFEKSDLSNDDRQILSFESGQESLQFHKDGTDYIAFITSAEELGFSLLYLIPEDAVFGALKNYQIYLHLFIMITLCTLFVYSLFMHRLIHRPLKQLVNCFDEVNDSNMVKMTNYLADDEFQYLYEKYNKMMNRIDLLINQNYRQKLLLQEMELKHLQSQINPHFLFNSLFMLRRMIQSDKKSEAEGLTEHLAEYFRFVTRDKQTMISLESEIKHTIDYIYIQRLRFADQVQFCVSEIPEDYKDYKVPRLILQPLVENAIEYGVRNSAKAGIISVSIVTKGEQVSLFVDDTGDTLTDEMIKKLQDDINSLKKDEEITALMNIQQRIRLQYGEASGVFCSKSCFGGLSVELRMVGVKDEERNIQHSDCG